jgi:ribose transport system permease protein
VTQAGEDPIPSTQSQLDPSRRALLTLSRVWAWVFLAALIAFFTLSTNISSGGDVNFLTLGNSQNILRNIVPVLLLGLGQTFVIISGGIDLSVGWVMGLASVASAWSIVSLIDAGVGEPAAIAGGFAIGLLFGTGVGLINGTIIAKLKVPSFIVTLGMGFVARGVALFISGGHVVGGLPRSLRSVGNESLIYVQSGEGGGVFFFQKPDVTGEALQGLDRVFQWPVVVAAIAFVIMAFLLARMAFGRYTYSIGGNREASLRAGVPVDKMTILIFGLSGFMASLAGILHTARFTAGSGVAGEPLLLQSIAAVIIGGVSMYGGRGNVVGTLIGALIIAILVTGLIMLGVNQFLQFIIIGVVVIVAVLIDQARDLVIGRAEEA